MKKKIRDLTTEEATIVCNQYNWCDDCPLFHTPKCIEYDEKELKQKLEQTILIKK